MIPKKAEIIPRDTIHKLLLFRPSDLSIRKQKFSMASTQIINTLKSRNNVIICGWFVPHVKYNGLQPAIKAEIKQSLPAEETEGGA